MIEVLRKDMQSFETRHEKFCNEFETKLKNSTLQIADLTKKEETAVTQLLQSQEERIKLSEDNTLQSQELATLKKNVVDLEKTYSKLEEQLATLEETNYELGCTEQIVRAEKLELQLQITDLNEEMETLQKTTQSQTVISQENQMLQKQIQIIGMI